MTALCNTFRAQSRWTWRTISLAHRLSSSLSETSVTEFNLLKIRQRHSSQVITKSFSQRHEAKTGGDWEWWLTGPSRQWIGFRLQAKIGNVDYGNYPHLHYQLGSGDYQSDILITDSRRVGAIPLYCLYSYWSGAPSNLGWRCGSFPPSAYSFGCTLMQASVVLRLRAGGHLCGAGDLAAYLFPWHCLFCCQGYGGVDLPERAWRCWQQTLHRNNSDFEQTLDDYLGDVGLKQQPPRYVQLLISRDLVEPPDPHIRHITVFRESTDEA